jgi:dihydroorotase
MSMTIRRPDDFHIHLRDDPMLEDVVFWTAPHFARALVMPNIPSVEDFGSMLEYRDKIFKALEFCWPNPENRPDFWPLMTIKLTPRTTTEIIRETTLDARSPDVIAAKLYPRGVTTASHDGIDDVRSLAPVLATMQDCRMVLCIHGESPSAFVLDRERAYLSEVAWIVRNFPGLRVVLEHVTTRAAVDFVRAASVNVAATITAHHLALTLDDVLGSGIRPHHFCYPVPKTPDDLDALINAAVGDESGKFFFGSDSAPHLRGDKESSCGCAGVFSAPVALPVLADVFFRTIYGTGQGFLSTFSGHTAYTTASRRLERFASINGAKFYGLPLNEGTIKLIQEPWTVPQEIAGIVPFRAGETLKWRVDSGPEGDSA